MSVWNVVSTLDPTGLLSHPPPPSRQQHSAELVVARRAPHAPAPSSALSPPEKPEPEKEASAASAAQDEEEETEALKRLVARDGTTFQHIILFNSLCRGNIDDGIDQLVTLHNGLLTYHGFLTGFQFIGVTTSPPSSQTDDGPFMQAGYFMLVLGFLISGVGAIVSFIALEYFNGVRGESPAFIVSGVLNYWRVFYISDLAGFASTVIFLSTVMVMVHSSLPPQLAYATNALFFACGVVVSISHLLIIPRRQEYKSRLPGVTGTFRRRIHEYR